MEEEQSFNLVRFFYYFILSFNVTVHASPDIASDTRKTKRVNEVTCHDAYKAEENENEVCFESRFKHMITFHNRKIHPK